LAAGAWQAALGQQDLQQNWVDGSSRAFDRASAGVPDLSHSELVPVLKRWAGGRSVNVICNARSNPFDVAVAPEEERDFIQGYYGLPIVTWSDKFRSFPTLYVTEQADFTWSLEFRRDYFIQINSTFELSPAFMFDGRLVFTVTPRGESVVPFPGWAI
jgi:hypothetical protein